MLFGTYLPSVRTQTYIYLFMYTMDGMKHTVAVNVPQPNEKGSGNKKKKIYAHCKMNVRFGNFSGWKKMRVEDIFFNKNEMKKFGVKIVKRCRFGLYG